MIGTIIPKGVKVPFFVISINVVDLLICKNYSSLMVKPSRCFDKFFNDLLKSGALRWDLKKRELPINLNHKIVGGLTPEPGKTLVTTEKHHVRPNRQLNEKQIPLIQLLSSESWLYIREEKACVHDNYSFEKAGLKQQRLLCKMETMCRDFQNLFGHDQNKRLMLLPETKMRWPRAAIVFFWLDCTDV